MKYSLKHQLQKYRHIIVAAILVAFGLMLYMNWFKSPNLAIERLYDRGYPGNVKEIIYLNDYVQDLKSEGYNRPLIRKQFYNNRWDVYADFYKYSPLDGGVEDIKSVQIIFSIQYDTFGFSSPKIKNIYSLSFSE